MNPIQTIQFRIKHHEQRIRSIYVKDKSHSLEVLAELYSLLNKLASASRGYFEFRKRKSKMN